MNALAALPIPMTSVLNQGCRLEMHAPLPAGEAMHCTAQLAEVEREPTKIKIATKITTGTASGPAYTALVHAVVPQKSTGPKAPKEAREPAAVPAGAECIAEHALSGASGRHYAFLSGDFNPIHWIGPAAKAAGFPTVILHGFAQMAVRSVHTQSAQLPVISRAVLRDGLCYQLMQEDLIRSRCAGDPSKLHVLDVKFIAPLVITTPTEMTVHVDDVTSTVRFLLHFCSSFAQRGSFWLSFLVLIWLQVYVRNAGKIGRAHV
jgi:acyl dehydratase